MSLEVHISETDDFNCQELHSSIAEVALAKGISDFEYNVDCLSGKKANYIANVFRVQITDTSCDKNSISVIVKTLVNTERQVLFHKLHEREVNAYKNVIIKFKELQHILYEHEKLILSECLLSSTEDLNEIIILEDLHARGFEINDKAETFEYLEFEQIKAVFTELAKFHALTYVFEKNDPDRFDEVKSQFHDLVYQNNFLNKTKLRNYFYESFEMSLKQVTDVDAKKKLEKIFSKLLEMLQLYVRPSKTNVLCHGDCWVSNMLFKFEEGLRTKLCFIDFQAMRYANPVTDIMYFLFICTNSEFRSNHMDQLKIIYYDSFKIFLNKFDIDANSVYKREEFNADVDEFLPYGLLIAMIELRIVTMTPEDEIILNETKLSSLDISEVPGEIKLFKSRVNDVVNESVSNGVLDKLVEKINF